MKKKRKIYRDKKGREYIKESYFVGGKMKFRRIFDIDGIPEDEFYERNATISDHLINEEYQMICYDSDSFDFSNESNTQESGDSVDIDDELPF